MKKKILTALGEFIMQRPGIDPGNYSDYRSYRSEVRSVGRDLRDARQMLVYVALIPAIKGQHIVESINRSYGGRLQWDGRKLSYTAGQYWPTEYRKAVCAGLANVIWRYFRYCCESKGEDFTANEIRKLAYSPLGVGVYNRWFR